ncbi:MAG: hypothetical protein GPJ54_07065 [Candidatus Heimdallarchaeota archaeon]|nr:hypothetical protein [Candidatus Heimdallarchaeota archaeon]
MKVLIPSADPDGSMMSNPSPLYSNFNSLILYDMEENTYSVVKNKYSEKGLKQLGVTDVIAHKICASCLSALQKVGISVWRDNGCVSIRDCIQTFVMGGLFIIEETNYSVCVMHKQREKSVIEEKKKLKKLN